MSKAKDYDDRFTNSSGKKTHKRHGKATLAYKFINNTITDK